MSTITQRPQPTLTTHTACTACTGAEQIQYADPELGTISFSADDGTESGKTHGEVEILSHDPHGILEVAYTLSADDWRKVVAHVSAGLPSRNLIARAWRRFQENRV